MTDLPAVTRIFIAGVASRSPLGCVLVDGLRGDVPLVFSGPVTPAVAGWQRTVRRSKLQWWFDDRGDQSFPIEASDVWLDLHGPCDENTAAAATRVWKIVDGAGRPVLAAYHALQTSYRSPFIASLYLVEDDHSSGPQSGRLLAEAHLSSSVPYRTLLDAIGMAVPSLLRTAMQASAACETQWKQIAPPRARAAPLLRSHAASIGAWLRNRIGGDVYGIAKLQASRRSLLGDATLSPPNWLSIPVRQGFIADPFFWPDHPGLALCEHYEHRTGRGTVAAIAIDQDPPKPHPVFPALVDDHHLSYPFTWKAGGRVFCLPEMAAARRQCLFEIKDGSSHCLCVVAEDVAMADPTLMFYNGLHWLAFTDASKDAYNNLCLMFSERLEGPWQMHPGNPVKIDARSSRPGGTPFFVEDSLYRPAQDCSHTYGGAVSVNLVEICTPQAYRERTVATLRPCPDGPYPDGLHTLSIEGETLLIDGKRISYHPAILLNKVWRRLRPDRRGEKTTPGQQQLPTALSAAVVMAGQTG